MGKDDTNRCRGHTKRRWKTLAELGEMHRFCQTFFKIIHRVSVLYLAACLGGVGYCRQVYLTVSRTVTERIKGEQKGRNGIKREVETM